jgi:hypothetical protein
MHTSDFERIYVYYFEKVQLNKLFVLYNYAELIFKVKEGLNEKLIWDLFWAMNVFLWNSQSCEKENIYSQSFIDFSHSRYYE